MSFTHLFFDAHRAKLVFDRYSATQKSFTETFRSPDTKLRLPKLGEEHMSYVPSARMYVLRYGRYLPSMPGALRDVAPVMVELIRVNVATVRSPAGFYLDPTTGTNATIERFMPQGSSVFVDNITVCGITLEDVNDFNSKLSSGNCAGALVAHFE
jgi:hypothetical protein